MGMHIKVLARRCHWDTRIAGLGWARLFWAGCELCGRLQIWKKRLIIHRFHVLNNDGFCKGFKTLFGEAVLDHLGWGVDMCSIGNSAFESPGAAREHTKGEGVGKRSKANMATF